MITYEVPERKIGTPKFDKKRYYKKRNKAIYKMSQKGISYSTIGSQFGISSSRVYQIVHREQAKIDAINDARKREGQIRSGEIGYSFLDALTDARKALNFSEKIEVRAYNCLSRAGIMRDICNGEKTLADYSDDELLRIRNFGTISLKLCREAYELWEIKKSLYLKAQ